MEGVVTNEDVAKNLSLTLKLYDKKEPDKARKPSYNLREVKIGVHCAVLAMKMVVAEIARKSYINPLLLLLDHIEDTRKKYTQEGHAIPPASRNFKTKGKR